VILAAFYLIVGFVCAVGCGLKYRLGFPDLRVWQECAAVLVVILLWPIVLFVKLAGGK
jgi:hypothetical protein